MSSTVKKSGRKGGNLGLKRASKDEHSSPPDNHMTGSLAGGERDIGSGGDDQAVAGGLVDNVGS